MRKSGVKLICSVLAAIMALSAMTGCGSSSPSSSGENASGASTTAGGDPASADAPYKYAEPVTVTWMFPEAENYSLAGAADSEVMKKLAEATNVTIEFQPVPQQDYKTKLNTVIVGQDLPDMVWGSAADLNTYGRDGAFVGFSDEEVSEKLPEIYRWIAADKEWCLSNLYDTVTNSVYAFPRFNQMKNSFAWMIRKDWLKTVGMEEPATLEEFRDVLRAFKEKDPGGVGSENVVPYAVRNGISTSFFHTLPAFGLHTGLYTMTEDGVVTMNVMAPEFKTALEYWKSLYAEGLMDAEFLTRDTDGWVNMISSNISGATFDYGVRTDQFTNVLRESNPDAELGAISPPAGPNGDRGISSYASTNTASSVAIASTSKNLDAIICLLNYIYSDEGAKLLSWGIDGQTYNGVDADGFPNWIDEIAQSNGQPEVASKYSILMPSFPRPITDQEAALLYGPLSSEAIEKDAPYWEEIYNTPLFNEEDSARADELYAAIGPKSFEWMSLFILGQKSLDTDYTAFLDDMRALGVDELNALYTKGMQAQMAEVAK